ncbi:MAG: nucleotide exchange factor GrpE [Chitinophagales bacterium]|nr:nucleotide exchange factor GrpE [Chitinophagales bacterium]
MMVDKENKANEIVNDNLEQDNTIVGTEQQGSDSINTETETDKEAEEDTVNKIQAALGEVNDKYIRLVAEFDNYRKRIAKEKIETRLLAGQDILKDLLPILDDLDRAEKAVQSSTDVEAVKEGFSLIKEKLVKNLSSKGLKEMEVMGEVFDADKHEAVAEFPAPSEEHKGKVFDVTEKGYVLNDKIIRFPKVVVSK